MAIIIFCFSIFLYFAWSFIFLPPQLSFTIYLFFRTAVAFCSLTLSRSLSISSFTSGWSSPFWSSLVDNTPLSGAPFWGSLLVSWCICTSCWWWSHSTKLLEWSACMRRSAWSKFVKCYVTGHPQSKVLLTFLPF